MSASSEPANPKPPAAADASVVPDSGSGDEPTRVGSSVGGAAGDPHAIPLGPSIEGYELKEEIHRGGQGVVYRAVQLGTKRQVALKVLLEGPYASESTRRRFEREIELAAALQHPSIVTILDSGLSFGRYFFAMEYIRGERLDRYLARSRLPLEPTLELFEKVCLAVNYAHQRGVIHRDLKPPNILVDSAGEPHVLDFGLAKHMPLGTDETTVQVLSTSGQLLGTVAYMSPEQAAGSQDVDVRTDVYSLGVIFYEALVGTAPYPVEGPLGEILTRIARDEPAHPRIVLSRAATGRHVDDELASILLKTLEKEPARRYQTAGDLAQDLRRYLDGDPIEAKRASGLYMFRKALKRYRLQAATAGAILLMLVGFLITFVMLFTSEREASRQAKERTDEARAALADRERALSEAVRAQLELRQALIRQHIQRGDLALERSDLVAARDSYWTALELAPDPAAVWALRRFYLQTANMGATLLTFEDVAESRLSPNAQVAAVTTGARGIAVSRVGGEPLRWVATPGPVTLLDVGDDGSLAAGGRDWAQAWPVDTLAPSAATPLPWIDILRESDERLDAQALHAVPDTDDLVLVGRRKVALVRGPHGRLVNYANLQGEFTGASDSAPALRQIALTTTAGVELVTIAPDRVALQTVWAAPEKARAVRFDGAQALGILAVSIAPDPPQSAVYVANIADLNRQRWRRVLTAPGTWELFDLDAGDETVALANAEGALAIYHRDRVAGEWTLRGAGLRDLRLAQQGRAVVTLDDQHTVTQWTSPQRIQQQRMIHDTPPERWAASADGSSVLLSVGQGQVVVYQPEVSALPRTLLRPRLLNLGQGEVVMSMSDNGERAVLLEGSTFRFAQVETGRLTTRVWRDPRLALAGQVALSGDGTLVAALVSSQAGDLQRVVFLPWDERPTPPATAPDTPAPFDFVGARIERLIFMPESRLLLVARSNGQLFLLDPDSAARPPAIAPAIGGTPVLEPWLALDSPASELAFSRTGRYLAVARADQSVVVVDVPRAAVLHRVRTGTPLSALSFNPRNNLLLVRTTDGTLRLVDPATAQIITSWRLASDAAAPLALWVGEADAMLIGYEGRVYEHRYQYADQLVERNRPYAEQRKVARHLAEGNAPAAWAVTEALARREPASALTLQTVVLETVLRASREDVRSAWIDAVLPSADAGTVVRLGHAAYDGERFDLAHAWLQRGMAALGGRVDALTLWRVAASAYLLARYDEAAESFARLLERPELRLEERPIAQLQLVAALVMSGRPADAREVAIRIGEDPRPASGERASPELSPGVIATSAARIVGRFLAGIDSEGPLDLGVDGLVTTFAERALVFHDDVHFFRGELERQRGDLSQAAVQYQRCIDLSRDVWPANWSRYRLRQLAAQSDVPTAKERL